MSRFLLKQFAGSASNNGIFGSAQQGAGTVATSIEQVQSLNAFESGWNSATVTADKLPCLEELQGVEALLCKAIKELYSEGIPQWISTETYQLNSFCIYNNVLYRNTTGTSTTNNPALDTTNWTSILSIGTSTDTSATSTDAVNVKYLHDQGYITSADEVTISTNQTITGSKTFTGTSTFSGTTVAPTVTQSDSSTNVATTAFVKGNIQLVSELPASPVTGVLYCIPES